MGRRQSGVESAAGYLAAEPCRARRQSKAGPAAGAVCGHRVPAPGGTLWSDGDLAPLSCRRCRLRIGCAPRRAESARRKRRRGWGRASSPVRYGGSPGTPERTAASNCCASSASAARPIPPWVRPRTRGAGGRRCVGAAAATQGRPPRGPLRCVWTGMGTEPHCASTKLSKRLRTCSGLQWCRVHLKHAI
jgi:hypothetical protein